MISTARRGSEKVLEEIFASTNLSPQQLATAVQQASASGLKIERWWWKGQPQPDWFRAVGTVKPDQAVNTIAQLIGLHNDANQRSCHDVPERTFHRASKLLIESGHVKPIGSHFRAAGR